MSSRDDMLNSGMKTDGLNPLLPFITGIIEGLDEATFADIQNQLESDLDRRVSPTNVRAALENGMKLGVINLRREFKVCREFTTKELKRIKRVEDHFLSNGVNTLSMGMSKQEKSLMEYVRRDREERRKKLDKKKRKTNKLGLGKDYESNNELSKYLCQRCKKSLERELMRNSSSSSSKESDSVENDMSKMASSSPSSSEVSYVNSRTSSKDESLEKSQKPEKSKLLIEKNPLETEPPYYDIFT